MLVEASSRLGMLCKYAHTHTSQRCCRRFTWYISAQTSTAIACNTLAKHADTHTHTHMSIISSFSVFYHLILAAVRPLCHIVLVLIFIYWQSNLNQFSMKEYLLPAMFSTWSTSSINIHQCPAMMEQLVQYRLVKHPLFNSIWGCVCQIENKRFFLFFIDASTLRTLGWWAVIQDMRIKIKADRTDSPGQQVSV